MWRAFCLVSMGVDIPAATVTSLLQEQADREKKRQKASSMESLHKRYVVILDLIIILTFCYRNLQKMEKHDMRWTPYI